MAEASLPLDSGFATSGRQHYRGNCDAARAAAHVPTVEVHDIIFEASDGFPLKGTLFVNPANKGPAILISGAIAVSRRYYAKFARAAVASGASAVLTYDYRGTGGSQPMRRWRRRVSMRDWAALDLPAATARLRDAVGAGTPLVAIGQSIGGTMFGLSGIATLFSRHVMIASGHGWLGNTDEPVKLFCLLNLLARPVAAVLGHAPAWMGAGMRLPRSILDDWGRYTLRRSFLYDASRVPEAANLARVRTPTLAIGFDDDRWTTRRALNALVAALPAAAVTSRWISPKDCGVAAIGHLGFFKSRFSESLWKDVIDWILANPESGPAGT